MTKSFRKSLDKIVIKRNSKSGENSFESADSEKDYASAVGNSMEIIDEKNDEQKIQGSPMPLPLIANPNLMLELNAKLGKQISSELSLKTETRPPVPSSPKPAFKESSPSFPQEQKPKSKIPRFSRSDSLVENANKNDDINAPKSLDEPGTSVNTRKVSTSKIPKMIGVKSSPVLFSSSIAMPENQSSGESYEQINGLKFDIKGQRDNQESGGQIINSPLDSNDASDLPTPEGEKEKTTGFSTSVPKSMSSSTLPKLKNQNRKPNQENINQNKTETKEGQIDFSRKSIDVANEEKKRKSSSSIPKLISTTQARAKLPIPEDEPRAVSLPSLNLKTPPGKESEKKESSSETNSIGFLLPPRKLSDSKIPQPVDIKNDREDLKPAETTHNKQEQFSQIEQKEEFKESKIKEEDDKITDNQMPEMEGSSRNDTKDPDVLKVPRTQKRSVPSIMFDDALSEFQKEIKISDDDL